MPQEISDPDFRVLASISESLKADYTETENLWVGSPFAWIKTRPPRQKGAIGENLVAGWLASRQFNIARSPDTDADRLVENKRVEIKFSMLWKGGSYTFQQFRDQRYDFAVCLGVSPFDAHCWVLEKSEILRQWHETGNIVPQHGGSAGSDTAWFSVDPENIHGWLTPYGGRLRAGLEQISRITGFQPPDPNE